MHDDKLELRMANERDDGDVEAVHEFIYKLGAYQKMPPESVTISKQTLKEQLEKKTLECVMAALNDIPVGIGLFCALASGFTGKTSMFLNVFYVKEELRGKGIGTEIIKKLSELSIERGYERIEWLCLNWNEPSLKFYRGIDSREIPVITFRLMLEDMKRLANMD